MLFTDYISCASINYNEMYPASDVSHTVEIILKVLLLEGWCQYNGSWEEPHDLNGLEN